MAQTTVAINLEAKTKGTESVKSLKTQIREATQDAIAMAQKFGEFSDEAITAAKRVAELKDQMQDFQQRVQTLNPDKFEAIGKLVGGLANGVQAAQGAMALFGGESEQLQKALLKVQGAMAFAQGINGVIEARKQFADFGKDAVSAFMKMTTASKAFLATGLGLIVAAIGYAVANFEQLAEAMGFAESEMQKMNKAMNIAAAETKQQAADLNYYNSVVQDTKKSEGERLFALQKLKEAGIATDDVNIANANSLQALNDRVAKQIVLIAQRARTEAAAQILQEKTKKLIEMQNGDLDDQITLWDRFAEASKAAASAGLYRQDLQSRANENIKKTQEDVNKATAVYQKEVEKSTKLEGVAVETSKQVTSTLKKQKDATKDLKQAELERIAEVLSLDKSTLEKQIAAADAAFAVTVKGLREKGLTEKQINQKRDAELEKIRDEFYAKEKAKREQNEKEKEDFIKQKNDSLLKANDAYFKAAETKLIQSGANQAAFDALEIERLQANLDAQKALFDTNSAEVIAAENELAKKKKEIYDKDVKAKQDAEKAKQQAILDGLQAAASVLDALAGLMKQGSDAQKAFALAAIAADSAKAVVATIVEARNTAKNLTQMGVPAPIPQIAAGAVYASGIAMVLNNVKRAKDVLNGGNLSAGGGGGTPPSAPAMAPISGGSLPDEQQFGGMGRVYVLEGDITKTQTRVRRLRNTSVV